MLVRRVFELGLVLYYVGVDGNVLEFTPLTPTPEEADAGATILDQAFTDLAEERVPEIEVGFAGWG